MSSDARRGRQLPVTNIPRLGVPPGWYILGPRRMRCGPFATEQQARLAARQEANRGDYERRRELAQARQKAEDAREEARAAEEQAKRAPAVLGGLVAGMARLTGRLGQRGQGHGAIYGPIRRGSRQRTKAGKGRR